MKVKHFAKYYALNHNLQFFKIIQIFMNQKSDFTLYYYVNVYMNVFQNDVISNHLKFLKNILKNEKLLVSFF